MRFETDQKSEPHRGFLLQFNTDFKAVISYLFRSHLLKLQACYSDIYDIFEAKNIILRAILL